MKSAATALRNSYLLQKEKTTFNNKSEKLSLKAFPQSFIDAPLNLIESMTNDPKDRHVLAAAVLAGADYLVTYNLKDFPVRSYEDYNLSVLHPDDFLLSHARSNCCTN